jgi:hypothetical protein
MQKRLLETNPNRYESTPSSLVPHPLRAAGELSAIPDRPQAPVPDPSSHGSQRPLWRRAEAHIVDFPLGTGSTPNSSGSDRVCRGVILTASARWWRRSWRRTVAATGTPRRRSWSVCVSCTWRLRTRSRVSRTASLPCCVPHRLPDRLPLCIACRCGINRTLLNQHLASHRQPLIRDRPPHPASRLSIRIRERERREGGLRAVV